MGNNVVQKLQIKDNNKNVITTLDVDGVFFYIGSIPNISLLSNQLLVDENGYIITDENMQTSVVGVFAAGDVRKTPLRQVITAVSDGAVSAVYAGKYLESLNSVA